ncbi:hypothetical protein MXB_1232 [Myxobolus squamalis]|nr:hypothetical protein MXB_1232 [Myxobolus squamalis]
MVLFPPEELTSKILHNHIFPKVIIFLVLKRKKY